MSHRTRDDDGRPLPEPGRKKRKKRPNLIGNSPNRTVYYELMQAGWSSTSLSFYADHRFGSGSPRPRSVRIGRSGAGLRVQPRR